MPMASAPLIERGDRLWDSSNVPHATRWQLDLPDRAGTFGYMADVLARQEDRLGGRSTTMRAISTSSPSATRTCMSRR